MTKNSVSENFASNVFNEAVMKERLPKETYQSMKKTMEQGLSLDASTAQIVANAHERLGTRKRCDPLQPTGSSQ